MTGGQMLERVQQKVPDYLGYVTSGDGYYPDGTYIAHSNIAYNAVMVIRPCPNPAIWCIC